MQLSSLFLAATALLTQAASADFLLFPSNLALSAYGPARIQRSELPGDYQRLAPVGFTLDPSNPPAQIPLDDEGDIGRGFLLRPVWGGKWALLAKNDPSITPMEDDITVPFAIEDGWFVYKGDFPAEWVTCKEGRDRFSTINIYLVLQGSELTPDCQPTKLGAIEVQ